MCGLTFAYLAYKSTGSAFTTVLVGVGYTAGYALSALPGSDAVRGLDRRWVIVGFDAAKILNYSTILAAQAFGSLEVWMIIAASTVGGLTSGPQYPAWQELLRVLSPKGTLDQTDGLFASVGSLGAAVGALVGGVLLDSFGAVVPLAINVFSYLPYMFVVAMLPASAGRVRSADRAPARIPLRRVITAVRKSKLIVIGIVFTMLLEFFAWPIVSLLPRIAADFGSSAHVYGVLLGAFYLGGMLVAGVLVEWKAAYSYDQIIRSSIAVCAVALIFLAIVGFAPWGSTLSTASAALLLGALGVVLGVTGSILSAVVQLNADSKTEGSILAFYAMVGLIVGAIGGLGEGYLADQLEIWWLPLASGMLIVFAMAWLWIRSDFSALDAADPKGKHPVRSHRAGGRVLDLPWVSSISSGVAHPYSHHLQRSTTKTSRK